ncbi:MAG: hypothetical protein E2O39_06545 [Planctomycetota bacterium]|nr:MAG: hypothetical protein E2O39_06545 [Planctomycetota bacterium]
MPRLTALEAEAAWRRAPTFAELCALGARFIEGELPLFPGWLATDIDEETDPIVPYLAAFNRAGFLTVASQPGRPFAPGHDDRVCAQRAFVTGFATEAVALELERIALATELLVTVYAVEERGGYRVPIGTRGGTPYLWSGYAAGREELELFEQHLSADGLAALSRTRYACVVDLAWGRRELLWTHLACALCPTLEDEPKQPV